MKEFCPNLRQGRTFLNHLQESGEGEGEDEVAFSAPSDRSSREDLIESAIPCDDA